MDRLLCCHAKINLFSKKDTTIAQMLNRYNARLPYKNVSIFIKHPAIELIINGLLEFLSNVCPVYTISGNQTEASSINLYDTLQNFQTFIT